MVEYDPRSEMADEAVMAIEQEDRDIRSKWDDRGVSSTWERTLSVYVDVKESWLMGEADNYEPPGWSDEMVIASPEWEVLKHEVRQALDRFYQNHHVPMKDRPRFDVDWEGKPELKR